MLIRNIIKSLKFAVLKGVKYNLKDSLYHFYELYKSQNKI
jgi:hypothetical protein